MKTVAKRWMVYVLVALLVMQGVYPAAYAQTTAQPEEPEATQLEAVEDNTPEEELTDESVPEDEPLETKEPIMGDAPEIGSEETAAPETATQTQTEPTAEKEIRFHTNVTLEKRSHQLIYDVYRADGTPVQLGLTTGYDDPYVVLEPGDYYLQIAADQFVQNGIRYNNFVGYTRDNHDTSDPTMTKLGDLSLGSFDAEGNFRLQFKAARNNWNTSDGLSYHRALAWLDFEATNTRKVTVSPKSNDYQTEGLIRKSLVSTFTLGDQVTVGGTTTIVPVGDYQVSFSGLPQGMQAEAYLGNQRLAAGDLNTEADQRIDLYVRPEGLPALPADLSGYKITTLTVNTTPQVSGVTPSLLSGGVALTPTQNDAKKFQQVIDRRPYTVVLEDLPVGYRVSEVKLGSTPIAFEALAYDRFDIDPTFTSIFSSLTVELEEVDTHTVTYQVGDTTTTEIVADGSTPQEVPAVSHRHYHSEWIDFIGWLDSSAQSVDPSTVTITADETFQAQLVDKTALKLFKNGYSNVSNATNPEVLADVLAQTNIFLAEQSQTQAEVDALLEAIEAAKAQLILGHRIVISPRDENDRLIKQAHVILELIQDGEVKYTFDTSEMTPTGSGSYNSPVVENGDYIIREIQAPAGYKLVDDVAMTIHATSPTGYKATFWKPIHQLSDVTATFSFSRELDEVVEVPEPITVAPGETITLPTIEPEVTAKYSFLGWYDKTDPKKTLIQPGETFVLNEDKEFVGLWEGNYGKAHLQFHTEEFTGDSWNRTHEGIRDLTGFEARVIRQDGKVYELAPRGDNYPGRMTTSGLSKGEYAYEITVPEGYRVVAINGWFSSEVVAIDLETYRFHIPWIGQNMTMGPSIFVQVEPIEYATVTYDAGGGTMKDGAEREIEVEVGQDIILPYDFSLGLEKDGQVFTGWLAEGTEDIYQPRASYTVTQDVTFVAQWEDVKGQLTLFVVDKDLSDKLPEPYLIDGEGEEIALTSDSYTNRERWWRTETESLLNGSYLLKFRDLEDGQTVALEDAAPSLRSTVIISQNEDGEDVLTFDFDENTTRSSRFVKVRATIHEPIEHTVTYQVGDEVTTELVRDGQQPTAVPEVSHRHYHTEWIDFFGWTDEEGQMVDPADTVIDRDRTFVAEFVDKSQLKQYQNQYRSVANATNPEILDDSLVQIGEYLNDPTKTQEEVDALIAEFEALLDKLILGHRFVISPRDENGRLIPRAHVILEVLRDGKVVSTFDTSEMTATATGSYNTPVLPNGDYIIREIKAPQGYGLVDDVEMMIEAKSPTGYVATFWRPNHEPLVMFQVEYDAGGGVFGDEALTVIEVPAGDTISLADPVSLGLSRSGYEFAGWLVAETDLVLMPGDDYTVSSDVAFVAQWIEEKGDTPTDPGDEETPTEPGDEETPTEPGEKTEPKDPPKKPDDKKSESKKELPSTGIGESTPLLVASLGLLASAIYLLRRPKMN